MREKILVILRGYKVLHGLMPGYLPVAALRSVVNAALPFVNIIASAMIINALVAGQPFESVVWLAIGAAVINFAALSVAQLLKRVAAYLSANIDWIYEQPLNEKQQEMDFAQIEDPETRFMREKMVTYRNVNGKGIRRLFWQFEEMTANFMTVLISIGVFAPVLASTGPADGFWQFVNTTWFAALFFLMILGNAVLGMALTTKRTAKTLKIMEKFHFPALVAGCFMDKLFNNYQAGKDIKVNNMRTCVDEAFFKLFHSVGDSTFKEWASVETKYRAAGDISANVLNAAVYIFTAVKTVLGNFGVGNIVQYIGGITRFNAGFTGLAANIAELFANVEALNVYFEFLDKPNKIYHGTIPVEKRRDNKYVIEFKNVSFKYPGAEAYALKNINLKLHIGQRMAVVGENGSGKTTMIKLLCRLYDPTEGEITLNGIDARKYDYQEYMNIFSVVFQDFKLFSFPLGQNVAASIEFDEEKVSRCLARAGFSERTALMPKGLYTPLYKNFDEEGVEISGGESQKIAIARALYKDAPFIVLDEPTAALDPIAEFEVYSKFNEIVEDKTAVFISHRLSSCRFCHDIAVFHDGRIIERGGHDELLADENGKYFELWNAQAQYYVNG